MSIKFNKIRTRLDLDDQITFGAHLGKTISYVVAFDPEYLIWCLKQPNFLFLTERAALALEISTKQMKLDKAVAKEKKAFRYDTDESDFHSDWDADVPF